MDSRRLEFTQQFDCVMFSFNGIDYVNYSERQSIFQRDHERGAAGRLSNILDTQSSKQAVASWLKYFIVKELVQPLENFLRPSGFVPSQIVYLTFGGNQGIKASHSPMSTTR